jgi:hypothetical protein
MSRPANLVHSRGLRYARVLNGHHRKFLALRNVAFAALASSRYTCYMSAGTPSRYEIAQHGDHVEVRGVTDRQVAKALDLWEKVRALQADHAAAIRGDLLHALMLQNVSLTPPATLAQAQRLATRRAALLATPVLTHDMLRQLRGDASTSTTRTWVTRRRDENTLFTVKHDGRTLIPAFQFNEQGELRDELQSILSALINAGIQGWSLWTWLTTPTSLLSGGIPEQVARNDPRRVFRAAERFAAAPAA